MIPVTFFHPKTEDISAVQGKAVDELWNQFLHMTREFNWVLQSALRLQEFGYAVSLASEVPDEGIVVVGAGWAQSQRFLEACQQQNGVDWSKLVVVTVNGDAARSFVGDFEIAQNGRYADGKRVFFVPHWPQPNLVPRHAERGTTISNVVYKGAPGNLNEAFRSSRWPRFLESHGINWVVDDQKYADDPNAVDWNDYSEADVVLAVRQQMNWSYERKPASKLVNAWRAGVPALLGPEYAYEELRESPLDFVTIRSLEEAMHAMEHLLEHPRHYQAMVAQGRRRGEAFSPQAIAERWASVLFERIPSYIQHAPMRWVQQWPMPARRVVHAVQRPPRWWECRMWGGRVLRSMKRGGGE